VAGNATMRHNHGAVPASAGTQFGLLTCPIPASAFFGLTVFLQASEHAESGNIVTAEFLGIRGRILVPQRTFEIKQAPRRLALVPVRPPAWSARGQNSRQSGPNIRMHCSSYSQPNRGAATISILAASRSMENQDMPKRLYGRRGITCDDPGRGLSMTIVRRSLPVVNAIRIAR
jgi:hypothetical protein